MASTSVWARLRLSAYAPALAVIGFALLAVIPWHPICPTSEQGSALIALCSFSPPLRDPTALELASVVVFAALLTAVPLAYPHPMALILLGLTSCAVIIAVIFSFDAYRAAYQMGLMDYFNQEARSGLALLFPSSAALVLAGVFRIVATIFRYFNRHR